MTTLSEINETLVEQGSTLKNTNDSINSLVSKISSQMEDGEKMRLKGVEEKRETKRARVVSEKTTGFKSGLMKGSGAADVMGMLSNMLLGTGVGVGLMSGALGLAFGKLLKGGLVLAISGVIGQYFSDEIMSFVKRSFDKDGDGRVSLFGKEINLDDSKVQAAITTALPIIAVPLVLRVAKFLGKKIGGLSVAGLGLLFKKAGFNKLSDFFSKAPISPTAARGLGGTAAASTALGATRTAGSVGSTARKQNRAIKQIVAGKVQGVEAIQTPSGIRYRDTTGTGKLISKNSAFAKADKALKLTGKFGMLSKLLGPLALGALAAEAHGIANSDLPTREKKVQLTSVLGSGLGGVGGAALGGMIGTAVFPGAGTLVGGALGGLLGALSGDNVGRIVANWLLDVPQDALPPQAMKKLNDETRIGFNDPDKILAKEAKRNRSRFLDSMPSAQIVPSKNRTTPQAQALIDADREKTTSEIDRSIAEVNSRNSNGSVSMSDNSTTTTVNQSTGFVMPQGPSTDLLDGGFALGLR